MRDGIAQMTGTQTEDPAAALQAPAASVPAAGATAVGRRLTPPEWQHVAAAAAVLADASTGRVATSHFEVYRDEGGAVHVVIPPTAG